MLQEKVSRLKEAHQAQACINSLRSPHQQPTCERPEEFNVTPGDLRVLVRVTQAGVERRAGAVEAAVGVLRGVRGDGFAAGAVVNRWTVNSHMLSYFATGVAQI